GFELRKLVETRTFGGFLKAAVSGTLVVAGPWILSVASIALAQGFGFVAAGEDSLAFTGAMVWAFALSMSLGAAPLNAFVRLTADLVYLGKLKQAADLLVKYALAATAVSLPLGIGFAFLLIRDPDNADLFRASFAILFASSNVLWAAMTTATVLRKHGRVVLAYALGMGLMLAAASWLGPRYGAAGALAALAGGYASISVLLGAATLRDLGVESLPDALGRLLSYLRRYRFLALAGTATAAAAWADKAVYWLARGIAAEGTSLRVHPVHDTAFFYANLSLIPGLVFYTLATETEFNLDLKRFLVFLGRRRRFDIEAARRRLAARAGRSLIDLFLFQAVVTLVIVVLAPRLAAALGFSERSFVLLAIGSLFQLAFIAAVNMLYYMELYRDAALSAALFLGLNLALAIAAAQSPKAPLGLPFAASAAAAAALALVLAFRGLERLDRILYLRASGDDYGL
ncbi:MAG: exopolysaccharide Pel transporter PelG, partial [Spirochaetaceae bacterium]|nr:exopolysaccharide Pel transporter PelG [Spirochaetaceae bacterium]